MNAIDHLTAALDLAFTLALAAALFCMAALLLGAGVLAVRLAANLRRNLQLHERPPRFAAAHSRPRRQSLPA